MRQIKVISASAAIILLSACATQQYYSSAVESWQGINQAELFKVWGRPDRQMSLPDGRKVYVYNSRTIERTSPSVIPGTTDVYQSGGQTYVTSTKSTYVPGSSRVEHCTTWFQVNQAAVITGASFKGDGCVANESFAKKYAAQGFD